MRKILDEVSTDLSAPVVKEEPSKNLLNEWDYVISIIKKPKK